MNLRSVARILAPEETVALRRLAATRGSIIERDGLSVLAFGRAATLPLPSGLSDPQALAAVRDTLAAAGSQVIALGAFHFRPEAGVSLTVPAVSVRRGPEAEAVAVVTGEAPVEATVDDLLAEAAADTGDESPPDAFVLQSQRPHSDYLDRVAGAIEEVRSGRLEKVVMAREVVIEANRPLRQGDLVERLRALHPSCATFAVEGFVGATPELLVRRAGLSVESHPLAGTAARSGDPEADRRAQAALLSSGKERAEHRAVVEAIIGGLGPALRDLEVPEAPSIVELRNVSHLGTRITGTLAPGEDGSLLGVLELLSLIHPTPAVAGTPPDLALEYLSKAEDLDRDRYAGAVGWTDGNGEGEWHLGIRCAIVEGRHARLFAGAGIVADSDPHAELAETQLKLQAVLAAAVRP